MRVKKSIYASGTRGSIALTFDPPPGREAFDLVSHVYFLFGGGRLCKSQCTRANAFEATTVPIAADVVIWKDAPHSRHIARQVARRPALPSFRWYSV
ncbi:hypothetical protein PROAA_1890018 [Candidatus Propionivibrio aalborgensis]|uniref:Uncharacterized protein n=1 Tax=Candidatus Propionivibrio aalborgensis TaxID=1860101 RepID=A0A1A8XMR0_9RHOO|nr:hypothetical protein PROAA_1890018 [Candidatus Propionivibrio aalborgensis]